MGMDQQIKKLIKQQQQQQQQQQNHGHGGDTVVDGTKNDSRPQVDTNIVETSEVSKQNDTTVDTKLSTTMTTTADFWKMTVKELQYECRDKNIIYTDLRKGELIKELQKSMDRPTE